MPSLDSIIAKAITPDATDTDAERDRKAVVKAQLDRGLISAEGLAAEMAFEAIAKTARERDPSKSFEQHYAAAVMDPRNADIARLLF